MFHSPRKHFGQHFLIQESVISEIICSANVQPTDHVIEIGPGRGALTLPLLKKLHHLTVIEIDRDLALHWQMKNFSHLTVIQQDALEVDFKALGTRLRLIGNLPYNISSPLLLHCLDAYNVIQDMHFMLQKEVVDRLAAVPGTKDYGRLSVMFQACSTVEALFDVGPEAFQPPPKVESSVLSFVRKSLTEIDPFKNRDAYEDFSSFLRKSFARTAQMPLPLISILFYNLLRHLNRFITAIWRTPRR